MSQTLSRLDLTHLDEISSKRDEPDWLKSYRQNSLSIYDNLPLEISPLYSKYTDAAKMDPDKVSIGSETTSTSPDFLTRRLGELDDTICLVQIGTHITKINIPKELESKGLIVTSIHDALYHNNSLVRTALESSDPNNDKFTALNNAAFNSGLFVYIPPNLTVSQPIHLIMCLPDDDLSIISRNIIHLGENSRATLVQELYSPPTRTHQAFLELLNVDISANAHLDITTLQMLDQTSVNFSTRQTSLAQDAKINWYSGLFGSILARYKIDYMLNGTGASANDSEVIFGDKGQSFDIQTNMNHNSPATEGRVVEKSILRDHAKSLFKGMIRIKENATKSNSFLSGRSILLDKDAKSDAIPGLEIFTNDVKATHSASVAQIDEEQIFYLQSRCLSKTSAERTIVEGFLEPLSRKMSYQVRAWIAYLIESKWDDRELSINTDEELTKFIEVEETRYNEDAEIEQHYKYR